MMHSQKTLTNLTAKFFYSAMQMLKQNTEYQTKTDIFLTSKNTCLILVGSVLVSKNEILNQHIIQQDLAVERCTKGKVNEPHVDNNIGLVNIRGN